MPAAFDRFRERKLVQWALAYLAVAWVLLEAFGFVAEHFAWPALLTRGAIILLAMGLPVVVVLAWYHGERGRQRVSGTELMLIAVLVAGAGILLRVFAPGGEGPAETAGLRSNAAPTRFLVLLPDGETLKATGPALAISRDGSKLVYAAGRGDTTRLYVRELSSFDARALPGTEGARAPFFSLDGERVGFFADRAVKKVSLRGGVPQVLVEGAWTARWEAILSGSWGEDDRLLLSYPGESLASSIWRIPATGGTPALLTEHSWDVNHFLPQLLPDNEHMLVSTWDQYGGTQVLAVSLETGAQTVLIEPGTNAHYVETGHIICQLGGDLHAVAFDPDGLEVSGAAVPVVEGVLAGEYETAQFAVSGTGTLAYVPAGVEGIERSLVWVDPTGALEPVPESRKDAYTPRISPQGNRVVFQRRPATDLWMLDLDRASQGPIPGLGTNIWWHLWTPDGDGLVFNADLQATGWLNLHEIRMDGTGHIRPLTTAKGHQQPQDWTADGEHLIYTEATDPANNIDIWSVPVPKDWTAETDRTPRPVLQNTASEFQPKLSPDGEWMAYVSDVSGQWEVYVTPFPGPGPVIPISIDGGSEPTWSPDGRTLYYRALRAWNMARQMMAVAVQPGAPGSEPAFQADVPRVLFDGPYFQCSEWGRSYDLAPDGSRFLMVYDQRPDLAATQINVVVNWFAEL